MSKLYRRALNAFGGDAQVDAAIEKMGVLSAALHRLRRGGVTSLPVSDGIAEVQVAMCQLSLLFGDDAVAGSEARVLRALEAEVVAVEGKGRVM